MTNENGRGWRNRIVNFGTMRADQFQAHPRNWRTHPPAQRRALATSLNTVGWVGAVLVNRQTGHLLDGHERLWQALEQGDDTPVPYIEVDVSEDEEHLILATLDPIGAMAETDAEMLEGILADLRASELVQDDAALDALLASVAQSAGAVDVLGIATDAVRENNNFSAVGGELGDWVGFNFGHVMVSLPRELHDRVEEFVSLDCHESRKQAVMQLLEAGLANANAVNY